MICPWRIGNAVTVQMVEEWIQSEEAEEPMGAPAEESSTRRQFPHWHYPVIMVCAQFVVVQPGWRTMPWLTVHIALPLHWQPDGVGFLVDSIPWKKITPGGMCLDWL